MDFKKLSKSAITYGLILGGVSVVYSMLLYLFGVNIFNILFSIVNFLLTLLFISVILTMGGRAYRKELGGVINYGEAFLHAIVAGIVFGIISAGYNFVFNQLIAPDYMSDMIDGFMSNLESKQLPQEQLDEIYNNLEKQKNKPIATEVFWSFASSFIFSAIVALITSIFVKKSKPVFEEAEY